MRVYFYLVAGHLFAGFAIVWFFTDVPLEIYRNFWHEVLLAPLSLLLDGSWAFLGIIVFGLIFARDLLRERLPLAFVVGILAGIQHLVFTLIKTTMVNISPFYADPFLIEVDELLSFGRTPWELTHQFQAYIPEALTTFIYLKVWLAIGVIFPVILLVVDSNKERVGRFLILYFASWVVLGNVIALVFMSCGPIFFDRVYGGNDFAPLLEALNTSGTMGGAVGFIQEYLWENYVEGNQHLGTGISAFPSVHIGVATMFALYIYERFPKTLPICIAFVLTYLFLSVFLGWHYVVDGYVSILFIVLLWKFLLWQSRKTGEVVV
ncbi:MAG: phosphatase PAP2 family protein [Falsihalocynthiibacter arcticus]|uniref:phosphatase PAP2 family protein n=1 Tax=Falsihalocynthiibacter sp. BN13B15 TaxID=3240871 RepID=UPI003002D63A